MSLRARLLLAFAYVLVVVIVALEVPLALNLAPGGRRGQERGAGAGPAARGERLGPAGTGRELDRVARRSARDLGGRVIVVDGGTLAADSEGLPAGGGGRIASGPRVARAGRRPAQGTRHSDSLDEDLLFTAVPVLAGRRVGAVR